MLKQTGSRIDLAQVLFMAASRGWLRFFYKEGPAQVKKLSSLIRKFDYVFFQDTLNEPVGATGRSPEQSEACLAPTPTKFVDLLRIIRCIIYEFMYSDKGQSPFDDTLRGCRIDRETFVG